MYGNWKTWTLWQIAERPDVDIFNGDEAAFTSFINGTLHSVQKIDCISINSQTFRSE